MKNRNRFGILLCVFMLLSSFFLHAERNFKVGLIVTGGLARSQTYELSGPIAEASLMTGPPALALIPVVTGVLAAFVAYGRWSWFGRGAVRPAL